MVPGYGRAHSSGSPPPSYLSQQDRGRGSQECELATLYTRGERSSREQGQYEDFLRSLHNTNTIQSSLRAARERLQVTQVCWKDLECVAPPEAASLLNCGLLKGEVS